LPHEIINNNFILDLFILKNIFIIVNPNIHHIFLQSSNL